MILPNTPDAVLLLSHNQTTLYSLTTPDTFDTTTIDNDTLTHDRRPAGMGKPTHLPTNAAQKSRGSKTPKAPLNPQYFTDITRAIHNAPRIILFSRGKGKSNAANHLLKHLKKHAPLLTKRIIANHTIDHPTTNQLIATARNIIQQHQHRYHSAFFAKSPTRLTPINIAE